MYEHIYILIYHLYIYLIYVWSKSFLECTKNNGNDWLKLDIKWLKLTVNSVGK